MKTKVLLVEDDAPLARLVRESLPNEQFELVATENGRDALEYLRRQIPDVILLDWNLPDIDGLKICQTVKETPETRHVPIIMLTAYGETTRKVSALETGADDYITKPFDSDELVARIRAILRRRDSGGAVEVIVQHGPITLNLTRHLVLVNGDAVMLTAKEFDLLYVLMKGVGRVMDRKYLMERVWGYEYVGSDRAVDVHIRHLREKLGANAASFIGTIRGVGYAFEGPKSHESQNQI